MNELDRAAARRADALNHRNDRPAQRRNAEHPQSRSGVLSPASLTLREADDAPTLRFQGAASVMERGYPMFDAFGEYTEIVDSAAFDNTLRADGLDVPLVLGHDQMRRVARTTNGSLRLAAAGDELAVDADLDPADADVAYIAPKLRSGLIDEMSFAFRIVSGSWSPDYTEYRIHEVDIHRGDVSIVGWGANPHTSASLVKKSAGTPLLALLDAAIGTHASIR